MVYKLIFGIAQDEKETCATYLKTFTYILSRLYWLPVRRVEWIGNCKRANEKTDQNIPEICSIKYELNKPHSTYSKGVQIVVFLGTVSIFTYNLYEYRNFHHNTHKSAAYIMSLLSDISHLGIQFLIWRAFWMKSESVVSLLNSLGQYENNQKSYWKFKTSFAVTVLVVLNIIMGFVSPHQRSSISGITKIAVDQTANMMGLLSCNKNLDKYAHKILYAPIYFCHYWSEMASTMSEYFLVVIAYTVYALARKFVMIIRATMSTDELMGQLRNLRFVNEQINSIIGKVYFLFFISTLTYYAATPAYLSQSILVYVYWYKLVYIGMHSLIWIHTSEFHRIVQVELRRWVSEKKFAHGLSALEIGKLNILATEIEHDPVGVSCRYFTVNYKLLSSLIGLLVTYSIVALQVQGV